MLNTRLKQAIEKKAEYVKENNVMKAEVSKIDDEIENLENQVQAYFEQKAQAARIRSKAKYYEDGEKSSKYFLGLEKTRYNNKTLNAIYCEDNTVTRDQRKILLEQAKFYRKLYSKDHGIFFKLSNDTTQKLDAAQKKELEEDVSVDELGKALKQMKPNKTPGCDGLPCEFYKVFWLKLKDIMWQAIHKSKERGYLYRSARRGVISLIPKKDKDPMNIKNWRPLTLLNVDHKMLTKAIANRMKTVLTTVISPHQSGYVPGRFIGSNIRKLVDIVQYLERERQDAILITVDFEKCFDSVDHEAMYKALEFFNFGEKFISWVRMIYCKFELCVMNNGYCSTYFQQSKGVHQGCGLSGPCFLALAEVLSIKIRQNPLIKHIRVNDVSEPICQYADDTCIITANEQQSVQQVINELEEFRILAGLKMNYEKSCMYKIGHPVDKKKYRLSKPLKWAEGQVNVLGIIIPLTCLQEIEDVNMTKTIQNAHKIVQTWKRRQMTLLGKIEIVNSLIGSLFVYKMQNMPNLSKAAVKKINDIIVNFVWNGRKPKIRLEALTLDKKLGGRKLVNVRNRDAAVKIKWVKRVVFDDNPMLASLAYYHINTRIQNSLFWQCNIKEADVTRLECRNEFWQSVVTDWAKLNYHEPTTSEEIHSQILWYNSLIKVNNQWLFNGALFDKGVIYVRDLLTNGVLMSCAEFNELYEMHCTQMEYNSMLDAIPRQWRQSLGTSTRFQEMDLTESNPIGMLEELEGLEKWAKIAYEKLNENQAVILERQAWLNKILGENIPTQLVHKAFLHVNKMCTVVKYRSFQYKLLHNAVICNDRLKHMGIVDSNRCTFCNAAKETISHLLVECSYVEKVWHKISKYLYETYQIVVNITKRNVFLSTIMMAEGHQFLNLLIMIMKQKIYAARCLKKKPQTRQIINELEFIRSEQYQKAMTTGNVRMYNRMWPDTIIIDQNMVQLSQQIEQITMP